MQIKMISRNKIEKMMNEALNNSINVLVAPTGYGKTQVLKAFRKEHDICNIDITEQHKRVDKFCEKFCHDIFGKNIAVQVRKISNSDAKVDFLIAMLNIASSRRQGMIIVIDNYHRIENKENNELVLKVAKQVSQNHNISIFLASRTMPKGQLGTFISQRPSSYIGIEHLLFDKEELQKFLSENEIKIEEKQANELVLNMSGWTEGIVTKLWSFSKGYNDNSEVDALIETNILPLFTTEMQSFLQVASKIDKFTSKITEFFEGKSIIKRELSKNAECQNFILKTESYYSIHPVLREFFNTNFTVETSSTKRLADYYLAEKEYLQAFSLYGEIKEFDIMAEICQALAEKDFFTNDKKTFYFMLKKLPIEYLLKYGNLSIWYAFVSQNYIPVEKRIEFYNHGVKTLIEKESIADRNEIKLRGEVGILKAFAYRNDWKKMHQELLQIKNLKGNFHTSTFQNMSYNLMSPSSLYLVYHACELDDIVENSREIEEICSKIGNRFGLGSYLLNYGEACYLRGERQEAFNYVEKALAVAKEAKQYSIVLSALYLEVKLFAHEGNFRSAESCINSMNYMTTKTPEKSKLILELTKAWLYPRIGKAIPKYFADEEMFRVEELVQNEISYAMLAYLAVLYYMQRYKEAYAYAVQIIEYYKIQSIDLGLIYANIYASFCSHKMGEGDSALKHMMVAYNLTKDDKIIMPFVEAGVDMIDIINTYKENFSTTWRLTVLREVKAFNLSIEKNQYSNKYRLSKREVDVMELVSLGMKNAEIAKELNIKQDTVKEYLHNVFVKLGVTNRMEAAMKFNES